MFFPWFVDASCRAICAYNSLRGLLLSAKARVELRLRLFCTLKPSNQSARSIHWAIYIVLYPGNASFIVVVVIIIIIIIIIIITSDTGKRKL